MSLVKTKKIQIGDSATATNNFFLQQPTVADGTMRLGSGSSEYIRFNSTSPYLEVWSGSAWEEISGGGDFLPLTGGTLTGSLTTDNGSNYTSISVKRSDQSAAGQNDQALVDVMSGNGSARFLHRNADAATISGEIRIYRGGETLFVNGGTERARITSEGMGLGTTSLSNGFLSIGTTGANGGITFNGATGGTTRIYADGNDAYFGARGGTASKGIKIDTNGLVYAQAGLNVSGTLVIPVK
jgi:hypothetical protein